LEVAVTEDFPLLLAVQILFSTPLHPRVGAPEASRATRAVRAVRVVAQDLAIVVPVALALAAKEMLVVAPHSHLERVQVVVAGQEQLAEQAVPVHLAMAVPD
jgi:hypothetical protein